MALSRALRRTALVAAALVTTAGAARADERPEVAAPRPFLLGDLTLASEVGVTAGAGRFTCRYCTDLARASIVAIDLHGQRRLTHDLAVFARVGVLRRGGFDQVDGDPHVFPASFTFGARYRWPVAVGATAGVAASVSLPMPGGGGNADATITAVRTIRDDPTYYGTTTGTARLVGDLGWRRGRLLAQGEAGLMAHNVDTDGEAASVRLAGAAGVRLVEQVAAYLEVSTVAVRGGADCSACDADGWFGRVYGAAGIRAGLGRVGLGAMVLVPLRDTVAVDRMDGTVSATVTAALSW